MIVADFGKRQGSPRRDVQRAYLDAALAYLRTDKLSSDGVSLNKLTQASCCIHETSMPPFGAGRHGFAAQVTLACARMALPGRVTEACAPVWPWQAAMPIAATSYLL